MQYVFDCAGVEERTNSVIVAPNPTQDMLKVNTPCESKLSFYDGGGQMVMECRLSGGPCLVDIRQLNPGLYFLRIEDGQSAVFRRIVVQ
jgi:hypothetical protein